MYNAFPKTISDAYSVTNLEPHGWGITFFLYQYYDPLGLFELVFV